MKTAKKLQAKFWCPDCVTYHKYDIKRKGQKTVFDNTIGKRLKLATKAQLRK